MFLLEGGGQGGVFHHTMWLADGLHGLGWETVVYTAKDHEDWHGGGQSQIRACVDWYRGTQTGWLRRAKFAGSFVSRTVPRLLAESRGSVVHVQGTLQNPLTLIALCWLRIRGRRVVYSPHNFFVRSGSRTSTALLHLCFRVSSRVVAFSEADRQRFVEAGFSEDRLTCCPLVLTPPIPDKRDIDLWSKRLGGHLSDRPLAIAAGQVRHDKRVDEAVRCAAAAGLRLAVVGEDRGALAGVRSLAAELGVELVVIDSYLSYYDFACAIAAADVALCLYAQASSSGILAVARELGTPTVAFDTGGLVEQATTVVRQLDQDSYAQAVREVLSAAVEGSSDGADALRAHVSTYEALMETP